jgi:hypothetical protein
MLLLVGPIKCGKTRVVHTVIPRLLAARCAAAAPTDAAAPRPLLFSYTFPLALPAEESALGLKAGVIRALTAAVAAVDTTGVVAVDF